jgi:hypothetical protein
VSAHIAQITENNFIVLVGESLKADVTLYVVIIIVLVNTNFFVGVHGLVIFLQIKNHNFWHFFI